MHHVFIRRDIQFVALVSIKTVFSVLGIIQQMSCVSQCIAFSFLDTLFAILKVLQINGKSYYSAYSVGANFYFTPIILRTQLNYPIISGNHTLFTSQLNRVVDYACVLPYKVL